MDNWQDTLIAVSNFGFLLAIMPIFFTIVFGVKTIEVGLVATGLITSFFLTLVAVAIFSLGAPLGATLTIVVAVAWFIIAIAALKKTKKGEKKEL